MLQAQTDWTVDYIAAGAVFDGADAIKNALLTGPEMLIVDAIRDADLHAIGKAARTRKLLVGRSGIAIGLPANFGATPAIPIWEPVMGIVAVLPGSCSKATRGQVAANQKIAPSYEINL